VRAGVLLGHDRLERRVQRNRRSSDPAEPVRGRGARTPGSHQFLSRAARRRRAEHRRRAAPLARFRALTIPAAFRDEFIDPTLGAVALYTFTPFEVAFVDDATLDPKLATLSAANTEGLAAGSAVEWLALGTYLFPGWLAPAEFQVVATGTVSSDGSRVEMDPGQGVPYLTWLAVRPKP
jgi:hypothetical protein